MIIFIKNIWAKMAMLYAVLALASAIFLMIKSKDYINLIWAIPGIIYLIITFISIWQIKVIIDRNEIIQEYGPHPFYKSKTMKWEDIDYIVKDGYFGLVVYRLVSNKPIKTRSITISGIKGMNSMIEEIISRAKNAKVDPEIKLPNIKISH